ncbi:unnamed protein product [Ixodes pacificus]
MLLISRRCVAGGRSLGHLGLILGVLEINRSCLMFFFGAGVNCEIIPWCGLSGFRGAPLISEGKLNFVQPTILFVSAPPSVTFAVSPFCSGARVCWRHLSSS